MSSFVVITSGGRRYHDDLHCTSLANGRRLSGGRWPQRLSRPEIAARAGYTACRVCVPPTLALPATGETHGHEPVEIWGDKFCPRCRDHGVDEDGEPWWYPVLWPCMSAVVLGLAPRCPDCGNGVDVPGGRKCASCEHNDQIDAWGTAL